MTVAELLSDLRSRGIHVWWDGTSLRYRAPAGALTPDLKSLLTERKPEVIAFLKAEAWPATAPVSIPRAPLGKTPALSFAEEGLWLDHHLRPSAVWNMQSRMRLRGRLDSAALERALNAVVQRQEILRTAFPEQDGAPARLIAPKLSLNLSLVDLSRAAEPEKEIEDIAGAEEKKPFDLGKLPLLRVQLLRLGEMDHVLLLTRHHIITDAWSAAIFFKELFALYGAAAGISSAFPALPVQYSDYAFWQRHLRSEEMDSQLSYWKNQLAGMRRVELPRDRPRSAERAFRGSIKQVQLPSWLGEKLRALCKRERVTPFMALLAAFMVLMHRYTGETDIAVGATVAGRSQPELEPLIGLFINLVVLRADLGGEPTFREMLQRVRETCLKAHQHQDYPFEKLVQDLGAGRDPTRNPLFQVLFNVVNLPRIPQAVNGLNLERMPRHRDTARFDLTLYAPETAHGFEIIAAYDRDLFGAERMAEMLEQYRSLLQQIVDNADLQIHRYSLLTPSARKLLPDPRAPLDAGWRGAIHEICAEFAERQPDHCAVRDPRETWSYRDLNTRSNRLAHFLSARGIARGDIVAIYGRRCAALAWALLGTLKAGAAFCVIDPAHPAARVDEYLDAIDPKGLILAGEPEGQDMLRLPQRAPMRCRIGLGATAAADATAGYPENNPLVEISPDDLAYVIFTSGSTGKPKGVMGRHGPLTHFLPWMKETFGLCTSDRFSFLSGLATNKLQREVFTALALGGTLCIPDPDVIGALGKLDDWIRAQAITIVHLTPAMARLLEATATGTMPSVRRVFFGGDLLRLADVDRVRRLMPDAEIVNFYNSSETQRGGSYFIFPNRGAGAMREIPPLGRGVKDVQLLVLNRAGGLAGMGELGEIHVRSPHLAKGYLGDEQLTRERFLTNPLTGLEADRVYRTGELGRFAADGGVEFVSRREDQVSVRGFRVDMGEIEAVLAQHSELSAAVLASGDHDGGARLTAYVVSKEKPAPSVTELRRYLRERLPDYMVPAAFVHVDAIPLTATGKPDRRALPLARADGSGSEGNFSPPRTPLESQLAEVWKRLLGLDRVGLYDNFFDLGGHSLAAVQTVALLEKSTGVKMHPKALLTQTLGQLACSYEQRMRPGRKFKPARFTLKCWNAIKKALFRQSDTIP